MKVVPATADSVAYGETERLRGREFAAKLSMRVLSRMWQMLLKGITEVQAATRPAAAAEMVLVRIAYVADLPTPDEAIRDARPERRRLADRARRQCAAARRGCAAAAAVSVNVGRVADARTDFVAAARSAPAPPAADGGAVAPRTAEAAPVSCGITSFPQLVALAGEKRDLLTKAALEIRHAPRPLRGRAGWKSRWSATRRARWSTTSRASWSSGPAAAGP